MENIEKCEDISEKERIMLTIILGKIKNDIERIGDINKLIKVVRMADMKKYYTLRRL